MQGAVCAGLGRPARAVRRRVAATLRARLAAAVAAVLAACLPGASAAGPVSLCPVPAGPPKLEVQEVGGRVSCRTTDAGPALHARAGPARKGVVTKAAVIRPFPRARARAGAVIEAEAMFLFPPGSPRDSVLLMDLECKHCGLAGNPGPRMYLRDGQLRIDRAKIGVHHAWARADTPKIPAGRWVRIRWRLRLGGAEEGRSQVWLDGREVLDDRGRTLPEGGRVAALDRLQIGITAQSNDREAELFLRDLRLDVRP
ncbi:hypothetical protein EKE94_05965 [Mesobaculum littorinae]|uniref:Uncharacterized protein n=1 Tax=Mesobaculum littorinae TaxID=2486419 RepID=A0A438AII2_9RHOB|nr:hypothetical protein [Mesobaculum littorinae]RVV98464.1 hypothetical protein EKE94_05965 [Mesobaculum littorinae]